jgi:hypothetical protein
MSDSQKPPEVSKGGVNILRHEVPSEWQMPHGDSCLEQISQHIDRYLGNSETVFHEIISDTVHIDVHLVQPSADFPFIRLVTSGMSDLPMKTPQGGDAPRYLELLITLPGDWKVGQAYGEDETWYWPIRFIKFLARLPHKYNTWLGWGHTVPNDDPPAPFATNTKLCGAILLPSVSVPDGFHKLFIHEQKTIHFFAVVPLYREELDLKLRKGTHALLDRLEGANMNDIVNVARPNVARKRFGLF